MRKLIAVVVAAGAAGSVTTAEASTTSMSATPASSQVGQNVTFVASFTSSCAGALSVHYFTIDGQTLNGTLAQSGQAGTETLAISTLGVGAHNVQYYWKNGSFCRGIAGLTYTVTALPSPSPSPSPSPTPSRPPSPTPSPIPSPSSVALVASTTPDSPLGGYVGAALIVVVVVAGVGLLVSARR